jgi:hypothetical protein
MPASQLLYSHYPRRLFKDTSPARLKPCAPRPDDTSRRLREGTESDLWDLSREVPIHSGPSGSRSKSFKGSHAGTRLPHIMELYLM